MECFAQFINIPVVDPDLQIRGAGWGGGGQQDLKKRGWGQSPKKIFSGLRASVWSKTKGGERGRPLPWICHCICHLHISHNTLHFPPPKKKKKKICITFFSFILGITAIPSEIEKNAYAKCFFFWGGGRGANKVHYGRCVSAIFSNL